VGDQAEKITFEFVDPFEAVQLLTEQQFVQHLVDGGPQLQQVDRFADEIVGSGLQRLQDNLFFRVAGHHDNRLIHFLLFDLPEQIQAADVRHHDIAQHNIDGFFFDNLQRLFAVAGLQGAETIQRPSAELADDRLVINDQQGLLVRLQLQIWLLCQLR